MLAGSERRRGRKLKSLTTMNLYAPQRRYTYANMRLPGPVAACHDPKLQTYCAARFHLLFSYTCGGMPCIATKEPLLPVPS